MQALDSAGIRIPSSCRSGVCQSCLVRAVDGAAPAAAQRGLKPELVAQGYFLACQALAERDLSLTLNGSSGASVLAAVSEHERLGPDVTRVRLEPHEPFAYRAGQFVNIERPSDGLVRSYSLANPPGVGRGLELHVRVVPGGRMSSWLTSDAALRQDVRVRGPVGECFYLPDRLEQPILLLGVGTGLAPLLGILRDALAQGHRGRVRLVHGARTPASLYLVDELRALANTHDQFEYEPLVLDDRGRSGFQVGSIEHCFEAGPAALAEHRVFVCGDPELVERLRKRAFLLGAARRDIHADAFMRAS